MILIRKAMGETLRQLRTESGRTLRDVSVASMVSLGYLSEIERGHKEASSEVLSSIAGALDTKVSDLLGLVSQKVALAEGVEVPEVVLAA